MKRNWQRALADKARWLVKNILKDHGYTAPIIANRTSVLDVLLLSVFLPQRLRVVLPPALHQKRWVKAIPLLASGKTDYLRLRQAHLSQGIDETKDNTKFA